MTMTSAFELNKLHDNANIAKKMLNASAATWFLTATMGNGFLLITL